MTPMAIERKLLTVTKILLKCKDPKCKAPHFTVFTRRPEATKKNKKYCDECLRQRAYKQTNERNRMKKLAALTLAMMFVFTPLVLADDIFENTDLGVLVQAHELIKIGDNHSIGAEVSITDLTRDWNDGSQAYIVYSYTGTIFGK